MVRTITREEFELEVKNFIKQRLPKPLNTLSLTALNCLGSTNFILTSFDISYVLERYFSLEPSQSKTKQNAMAPGNIVSKIIGKRESLGLLVLKTFSFKLASKQRLVHLQEKRELVLFHQKNGELLGQKKIASCDYIIERKIFIPLSLIFKQKTKKINIWYLNVSFTPFKIKSLKQSFALSELE